MISNNNQILELPTLDANDLLKRIEKVLYSNDFKTYIPPTLNSANIENEANVGYEHSFISHIPQRKLDKFADFLITIYKQNNGAKHYMTLALGSYLARFVDAESVEKLGKLIIQKEPQLFNDDKHFLNTLLKNYDKSNGNKKQVGGATLYQQYGSKCFNPQEFWFKLIFYTNATVSFFPTGKYGSRYKQIVFNQYNQQVEQRTFRLKKDEDGEFYPSLETTEPVLGCEIVSIERIENPIIKNAPAKFRFSYILSGETKIRTIEATNMAEIEDQLKAQVGLVLGSSFKNIFNQIIAFWTRIHLIDVSEKSQVAGFFVIENELKRYNYNLNEVKPIYSKEKLKEAMEFLIAFRDIIPTDNNKFGAIIRIALLLPFTFVLRENGKMGKFLLLAGAGKTLKSTIAELCINLYNPTRLSSKDGNIFSAGSFGSEYQVGQKFGISSYPFVVNEPAKAFNDDNITEVLKSSIESQVSRITKDGTYYSYSSAIFCSNVDIKSSDAIVRRNDIFYFAPSERASEEDIKNIADLCNKNGVNDRFKELNTIGQFVFCFLHDNFNLIEELSKEDLEIRIIEELEKECNLNLDWMKEDVKEDNNTIIEELDNETLTEILNEIKRVYNFNFRNFSNVSYKPDEELHYSSVAFSEINIINLVTRGAIPFLVFNDKNDEIFIVGNRVKQFFQKQGKIVSNNQLYDEFESFSKEYNVEKKRIRIEGKYLRGIAIEPELLTDLMNNSLKGDDDNE